MSRAVVVIVAFLAVGLSVPGAVAAAPDPGDQPVPEPDDQLLEVVDDETEGNETGQNGIGQRVSSFVQSTTGNADGAVEQGMWEARMADNASDEDVAERADALGNRLAELREERAALREARRNGTVSKLVFASRMAQLNGQLDALAEAANGTSSVAEQNGLDTAGVDEIGAAAREEQGPPGGVPGGGDENAPTDAGPQDDTPGQGAAQDDSPGQGNARDDPPGQENASDDPPGPGNTSDDPPGQGGASDGSPGDGGASDDSSGESGSSGDSPGRDNASDGSSDQGEGPDDSPGQDAAPGGPLDPNEVPGNSRGDDTARAGPPA